MRLPLWLVVLRCPITGNVVASGRMRGGSEHEVCRIAGLDHPQGYALRISAMQMQEPK